MEVAGRCALACVDSTKSRFSSSRFEAILTASFCRLYRKKDTGGAGTHTGHTSAHADTRITQTNLTTIQTQRHTRTTTRRPKPQPTQQPQEQPHARSRPLPAADSEEAAPSEPDPASTRSQSASPRLLVHTTDRFFNFMVMMFHSSVPNDRGAIHKHGARAAADDIYLWSRRLGFGMIVASHDPKDQSGSHIKVRALAKGGWSVPCVSIQLTLSQGPVHYQNDAGAFTSLNKGRLTGAPGRVVPSSVGKRNGLKMK